MKPQGQAVEASEPKGRRAILSDFRVAYASTPPQEVCWHLQTLPIGKVLIARTPDGLICRLSFLGKQAASSILAAWQKEWPHTLFKKDKTPPASLLGKKNASLLLVGTPFQQSVWTELLNIPCGQTITYGEMARRIGNPKAARAVGTALGANPVPLLVPCHRVVATNGLGGFTGGLPLKKKLLATEQ